MGGNLTFEAPPTKPNKGAYITRALDIATAALQHSPLVRHGFRMMQWRVLYSAPFGKRKRLRFSGRRVFNSMTINKLISSGVAVRDGNYVRLSTQRDSRGSKVPTG